MSQAIKFETLSSPLVQSGICILHCYIADIEMFHHLTEQEVNDFYKTVRDGHLAKGITNLLNFTKEFDMQRQSNNDPDDIIQISIFKFHLILELITNRDLINQLVHEKFAHVLLDELATEHLSNQTNIDKYRGIVNTYLFTLYKMIQFDETHTEMGLQMKEKQFITVLKSYLNCEYVFKQFIFLNSLFTCYCLISVRRILVWWEGEETQRYQKLKIIVAKKIENSMKKRAQFSS